MNKAQKVMLIEVILIFGVLFVYAEYTDLYRENLTLKEQIKQLQFPYVYRNQELRNSYFINASFTNIVARSCIFKNCTIYESKLIDCYTMNSTVVNTLAVHGTYTPMWVFEEVFQEEK